MRDKDKDAEWRREHNTRLVADIPKEQVEKLKEKLRTDNISYQAWLKKRIAEYLQLK